MNYNEPNKYKPHYPCAASKKKKICEKCDSEFYSTNWAVRNCVKCRKKK